MDLDMDGTGSGAGPVPAVTKAPSRLPYPVAQGWTAEQVFDFMRVLRVQVQEENADEHGAGDARASSSAGIPKRVAEQLSIHQAQLRRTA